VIPQPIEILSTNDTVWYGRFGYAIVLTFTVVCGLLALARPVILMLFWIRSPVYMWWAAQAALTDSGTFRLFLEYSHPVELEGVEISADEDRLLFLYVNISTVEFKLEEEKFDDRDFQRVEWGFPMLPMKWGKVEKRLSLLDYSPEAQLL
jgi:hypothetical protein